MKSSLRAAALALVAGTVTAAPGAILQWDALFSGNASTANNWNPNQRPTAVDDLRFDSALNNNYTVTYDALVPTVRSHQYLGDNVTIRTTNAGGHTVTSTMSIENGSEILLDAGTVHVGGAASIGATSALGGRLSIQQSLFGAQQVNLGGGGVADVIVSGAARFEVPVLFMRGDSSLTLQSSAIGELTSLTIGSAANAVASSVLVTDGADMNLAGGLTMSPIAGAASALRVLDGPVGQDDATVRVTGDLLIAANTSALAAGTASVVVENPSHLPSAAFVSCDDLVVGDANGGQGSLSLQGGGLTCASARFVAGHSTLDMQSGRLTCTGPFVWENGPLSIDGAPGVILLLEGTMQLASDVRVGTSSFGEFAVSEFGASVSLGANLLLGDAAGGSGELLVGDQSVLDVAQHLRIGGAGTGTALIVSFARTDAGTVEVAASPGSSGDLRVEIATLAISNGLYIGGTATTAGGSAQMNLVRGVVVADGPVRFWPDATVDVGAGLLSVTSTIDARAGAELIIGDGQIEAPQLALNGAASAISDGVDITGNGDIDAAISASGFGNNITADGPLFLGRSTSISGYNGPLINLAVGPHTVTLRDSNAAVVGDTSVAAGTLAAPNGLSIASSRTVSGTGTIDAPTISNSGTLTATTPQGFVVKGIVSGAGSLTGTLFDFSTSGGFTGTGTINSQIRGSAGSIITSTGALSLGTASSVGFSFDGTLSTGANTITLHDTSTAFVGNIELAGGTVFCSDTDMTSDLNDVASGFGTIATTPRTWINAGIIRPGGSGTDATGQISVAGNVNAENVFNSTVFDLDIGGTSNANIDRFVVVGALTIDGTLRVRFVPGYVPAGGEVYTVITANSITGNFTSLDLPPRTRVIVNPTNVQVEALCTSDQNADGTVDGDDVIDLFAAWDLGLPEADTNGDGSVDGDDVIVFFEHWDAGC